MNATGRVQITPHRTHTRALLLAAHTTCDLHVWLKVLTILCVSRKVILSLVMSLLNVPSTPFPPVFSPSTTTPTPLTGIRLNPRATPLWGGPSGHLADPTPNTGYEPKICIDVASTRRSTFRPETRQQYDATIAAFDDLNLPQHSGAPRSSQHTAASTVPTLLKLGSFGTSLRKLSADNDSVASRTGIKETCADLARETVVSSLLRVCVNGEGR